MSRINMKTGGAAAAALMLAVSGYVGGKEGLKTKAYRDSVGVWTICQGETKGVHPGMHLTVAQCNAMFGKRLDSDFASRVEACIPDAKDAAKVKTPTYVAFVSLSYNIGTGGFCRSSVARLWNRGDHEGACHAIRMFNRAGGHVLKGLDTRRRDEEARCLEGIRS